MTNYYIARNVVRSVFSTLTALGLFVIILSSVGPISRAEAAASSDHRAEDIAFLEINTNFPDIDPQVRVQLAMLPEVLSASDIHFLEINTYLPGMDENIAKPASVNQILTSEDIRFLEMNIWEFATVALPAHTTTFVPPEFEIGQPS